MRFLFGFGAEARFFPLVEGAGKGFFATARPFEIGFMKGPGVMLVFSLGAGYAF